MTSVSVRPGIVVRVPVKFPANVSVSEPLILTRNGANYAFSIDPTGLFTTGLDAWFSALPAVPGGATDWWNNQGVPTNGTASVERVRNIAALRTLTITAGRTVNVDSYYVDGDGAGGQFYARTSGGPFTDNGGTIITPNGASSNTAWLRSNSDAIDVRMFGALGDGITNDAGFAQAALTYAAGVATDTRPVKVVFPEGFSFLIGSTLTVGNNIELTGGGTLIAASSLALTSPVIRNTSELTSANTRFNYNIKIRNLVFDGSLRRYPEWLENPVTGAPITNPDSDYSVIGPSTSTLDPALYPSGDIAEVVAANRRNPATYNLRGYIVTFSGCYDSEIVGCEFRNHMSSAILDVGGLRNRIADNRFDNIGRVSFSSNAVMVADYGSARIVTNMTKANPAAFETATAMPVAVAGQIRTRNIVWGSLADGLYTVGAISGNNTTATGLNTTGFASFFPFNGRATITTSSYVQAQFVSVENNTFYNLKRAAIQATGSNLVIRGNKVFGSLEGGIYLVNLFDSMVSDNFIRGVRYADLVANGIEANWIVGCAITNNTIKNVDENGITLIGGFDCDIRGNTLFRSGDTPGATRLYGPFSERYDYGGGTPIIAGTASSSEYKAPLRIQSSGTLRASGRVSCNTCSDTRLTPVNDAAIVFNQTSGVAVTTATIDNGSGASGTVLTVSAIASGMIAIGMTLTGTGVAAGTRITAFVSGTYGGVGVYTVDTAHNLTSRTITCNAFKYVRDLQIFDNDFTYYPTSDVNLLIDLGSNNVSDAQTIHVRGNKKHPSQSAFTLVSQDVSASGFLDIVCGFPPSAIEIEAFYPDGTTTYPTSRSIGSISKTAANQGPSSTVAHTMVWADTAGRFIANASNIAIRLNGTGTLQFSAEFTRFNVDGFRINVTNATQPVLIRAKCYP
jgi:hypothetical protein